MFCSGNVAVRSSRWRVSVSLDPAKWSRCSESSISHVNICQPHRHKIAKKKLRVRTTFSRIDQQNAHETVARARFHIKFAKKLTTLDHFFKMRSTKCARYCSESSISHKHRKKLRVSEHFWPFIPFNSFTSIHSCQVIRFNSFVSIHSFQIIHVNSLISIQ